MKILFQGDSVTDACRDRSNPHDLGEGYPKYAAAMMQDAFPQVDFEFIDLGIGGNRTEHLVQRLESDFVDIQPDIVDPDDIETLSDVITAAVNEAIRRVETTAAEEMARLTGPMGGMGMPGLF